LGHVPDFLAVSPEGGRLYTIANRSRRLSIVSTADDLVRTLDLPRDGGPLAVSPDGTIYVGSMAEGIMVVDASKGASGVIRDVIPTGGPVWNMAITPDGRKIFLAMGKLGIKRLSTQTRDLIQITDRVCRINVVDQWAEPDTMSWRFSMSKPKRASGLSMMSPWSATLQRFLLTGSCLC
jgi:DNA-binding beta-propeller fold protein YncE